MQGQERPCQDSICSMLACLWLGATAFGKQQSTSAIPLPPALWSCMVWLENNVQQQESRTFSCSPLNATTTLVQARQGARPCCPAWTLSDPLWGAGGPSQAAESLHGAEEGACCRGQRCSCCCRLREGNSGSAAFWNSLLLSFLMPLKLPGGVVPSLQSDGYGAFPWVPGHAPGEPGAFQAGWRKNVRRKLQELGLGCLFPLVAVGAHLLVWVSEVCFPIPVIPFPMLGMKQGLCLLLRDQKSREGFVWKSLEEGWWR